MCEGPPGRGSDQTPPIELPLALPPNLGDGPQPLPPRTLPGTEEAPVEAPDPGFPTPPPTPTVPVR